MHQKITCVAVCAVILAVIALVLSPYQQSRSTFTVAEDPAHARQGVAPQKKNTQQADNRVWRIHIEIDAAKAEILREASAKGWQRNQLERAEVLCTVREESVVYTNVTVRLKGSGGSFRPFDDKPSLTLGFSKHASGQTFHGYSKVSLNNSVQDPSYLAEALSRELFEAAGVPTPRAHHATVQINDRNLGLYVLTEGFGKGFLRRYFTDVRGNLYDGGVCQEITGRLATNSGDDPDDQTGLQKLAAAANSSDPDPQASWTELCRILDIDRFISFSAMEIMTCHWDGYSMNRNNYRVFHDRETDRMVFMPHGLDQMFGVFRSTPQSPITPPMHGLVARAVVATRQGRQLFLDRVAALRHAVFTEEKLTNRIYELRASIQSVLEEIDPDLCAKHGVEVARLAQRATERAASISEQLQWPQEEMSFGQNGVARPSIWRAHSEAKPGGNVRLDRIADSGKELLRIRARDGGGIGFWRTRVILKKGRYIFQGQAKVFGADPDATVCLRPAAIWTNHQRKGDHDWVSLSFKLLIEESIGEVDLVCEFRAKKGDAWFDLQSIAISQE